jgi:glycosyltransferase involved in cell wall biosynthesis
MKIAVVGTRGIPGVTGGVERHCQELYPRIVARGAEVVLYARDKYVPDDLSWNGVDVVSLPASRGRSTEAISHTFRALMAARCLRPDIVHIHSIGPASLTWLARALGMRVVVTMHAADYLQSKWGALASAYLRLGEAVGARGAAEVISVSRHYGDYLEARYGRPVSVIPGGPSGVERVEPGETIASLELTPGRYALFVGRLTPDKRVEDAIAACSGADAVPLVIVGGPAEGTDYAERLHAVAAGSRAVFAGDRSGRELAELFSAAGVFVLPSAAEGLSMSLLEAMAYGLPCVASDVPGNRELLAGGAFGALAPVGDVETLREAIAGVLAMDPGQRDSVSEKLRSAVAETYDWERIADRTMEVYRKVVT